MQMNFSVFICIVVFCTSAVNTQQNGSEIVMEIVDNLAQQNGTEVIMEFMDNLTQQNGSDIIMEIVNNLSQLNPLGILDETYIDRICRQVNNTERDDICFKQLKIVCQNETFRITSEYLIYYRKCCL